MQADAPVDHGRHVFGSARQSRSGKRRQLAARVEAGLQCFLLRRTIELPEAEPRRDRDARKRGAQNRQASPCKDSPPSRPACRCLRSLRSFFAAGAPIIVSHAPVHRRGLRCHPGCLVRRRHLHDPRRPRRWVEEWQHDAGAGDPHRLVRCALRVRHRRLAAGLDSPHRRAARAAEAASGLRGRR